VSVALDTDILIPLVVNVVSGAISWLILRALQAIRTRRRKFFPGDAGVLYLILAATWATGAYYAVSYAALGNRPIVGTLLVAIPTALIFAFLWHDVSRYWRVGVRSADASMGEALRPDKILSAVKNSLDFLGTGASKLTSESEFREAVMRVTRNGSTVRMLLSQPDSTNLRAAAQRSRKPIDAYERVVKESLRIIADLHTQEAAQIEVRFYTGIRRFRLMFVDDLVCLFSYNVYASESPLSFPALRLVRSAEEEVRSFYWAMEQYFVDEWNQARPWNFQEFLT
jgi:hypothetical protein